MPVQCCQFHSVLLWVSGRGFWLAGGGFSTASLINLGLDALRTRTAPRPFWFWRRWSVRWGSACFTGRKSSWVRQRCSALQPVWRAHYFSVLVIWFRQNCSVDLFPVLTANCWGMLWGWSGWACLACFRGRISPRRPASLGWLVWSGWRFLLLLLRFSTYLTLVGRIGPGRAGYATVVFPVFALFLSALFEGYHWSWLTVLGVVLVAAGNIVMLRSGRPAATLEACLGPGQWLCCAGHSRQAKLGDKV